MTAHDNGWTQPGEHHARTCCVAAHPDLHLLLPQGLSDWSGPELPRVGEVLHRSCGLYALVPDHRVGVGGWWSCGCCRVSCRCVTCHQQHAISSMPSAAASHVCAQPQQPGTDSTQQQPKTCSWRGRSGTILMSGVCATARPPARRLHAAGVVAVQPWGQGAGSDLRQPLPEHGRMVPGAHAHGELAAPARPPARLPAVRGPVLGWLAG